MQAQLTRVEGRMTPVTQLGRWIDRAEGLDLGTAPLLRVTLARLSDTRVQVVWTFHHLLLDGWSVLKIVPPATTTASNPAMSTPSSSALVLATPSSSPRAAR